MELYIFAHQEKCVMSFVRECEMSEMKACPYRPTMRKEHQDLLHDTVRQQCPTTFLSEITELTFEFSI